MAFIDLFGSGEHLRNLGHFSAIVNLAAVDGEINSKEEFQLKRFAVKLNISEVEYLKILKNPTAFPLQPPNNSEKRLERLYDLFTIIYSDHEIDHEETLLIKKYAIGLGYSPENAAAIIMRSVEIFSGKLDIDDYRYLLYKK